MNPSGLNSISNLLDNILAPPFDFDDPDSTHKPDWLSNTFDNIPASPLELNPSSSTNDLNSTSYFLFNDPLDITWAAEWLNSDGELLDHQAPVMSVEECINWQPPLSDSKSLNDLPELPLPQVRSGAMANGKDSERSASSEEPVQVPGNSNTPESSTGKRQTTPLSSKPAKIRKFLPACERCRVRKSMCDKESPCNVCRSDSAVCVFLPRKFRTGVLRACDRCRTRKTKCDGESPCTVCKSVSAVCTKSIIGKKRKQSDPITVGILGGDHGQMSDYGGISSERGRTRSGSSRDREQSANSGASSGYSEIIFDSNSVHSRASSAGSATSGRRGPLSDLARAGMNALKRVGACWRCKFLRKQCDPDSPCALCPRGDSSRWEAVGCQRGSFKDRMLPILLCPKFRKTEWPSQGPEDDFLVALKSIGLSTELHGQFRPTSHLDRWSPVTSQSPKPSELAPPNDSAKSTKDFLRTAFDRREEALVQLENEAEDGFGETLLPPDDTGQEPSSQDETHDCAKISSTQYSKGRRLFNGVLSDAKESASAFREFQRKILNDCVLAIGWELVDQPDLCSLLGVPDYQAGDLRQMYKLLSITLEDDDQFLPSLVEAHPLARLLSSTTRYHGKYQSHWDADKDVPLVSQSLICFRYCLEALRAKRAGLLETRCHESCDSACTHECLRDLIFNVSLYLDELSRVFFLKENMREKTTWWLSTFYSFCIQSFVRKALVELETVTRWSSFSSSDYLRLPVRLFIASSGSYDPLCEVSTSTSDGEPHSNDYREVQLAVSQSKWSSEGINGSGGYLKRLFEDNRETMGSTESGDHVGVVHSRPKPQCWQHGCNGRQFSTFSNLLRHQREKSGAAQISRCPSCGAEFTQTSLRNRHLTSCMPSTRSPASP